jgi:hypothetical protein
MLLKLTLHEGHDVLINPVNVFAITNGMSGIGAMVRSVGGDCLWVKESSDEVVDLMLKWRDEQRSQESGREMWRHIVFGGNRR